MLDDDGWLTDLEQIIGPFRTEDGITIIADPITQVPVALAAANVIRARLAEHKQQRPRLYTMLCFVAPLVELEPSDRLNEGCPTCAHGDEETEDGRPVIRLPAGLPLDVAPPSPGGTRVESAFSLPGVLDHEIGHAIEAPFCEAAAAIEPGWDLAGLYGAQDKEVLVSGLSRYAVERDDGAPSDEHEWFAESFAAWVHPQRDGADFALGLEGLFEAILGDGLLVSPAIRTDAIRLKAEHQKLYTEVYALPRSSRDPSAVQALHDLWGAYRLAQKGTRADAAEFQETKHKRGGQGTKEGGKFVAAGQATTPVDQDPAAQGMAAQEEAALAAKKAIKAGVPKPYGFLAAQKNKGAAVVTSIAEQGIEADEKPEAIAEKIKAHVGQYVHTSIAKLGNLVLAHLETEYGLGKGALGTAKSKPLPVKQAIENPPPQQEPEPTVGAQQKPGDLDLPKPSSSSTMQEDLYETANNENLSTEQKIAEIDGEMTYLSPETKIYAKKLLDALGYKEPEPAAAAPEPPVPEPPVPEPPVPEPPETKGPMPHPSSPGQKEIYKAATYPSLPAQKKIEAIQALMKEPGLAGPYTKKFGEEWIQALGSEEKGQFGGTVVTAPKHTMRYKRLTAIAEGAKKPTSTMASDALAICPTLGSGFWAGVSPEAKAALGSYWDGGYGSINSALRSKNPEEVSDHVRKMIDNIDDLFYDPNASLQADVQLTRGENVPSETIDNIVKQLSAGVPVAYQKTGFISTSMAHKPAFNSQNTWFIMTAKKGTPALGVDTISSHNENEVLLRHGQSFEIYQVERTASKTFIYMVTT